MHHSTQVYSPVTVQTRPTDARPGFASITAKFLGVSQIILGVTCMILQIVCIIILTSGYMTGAGFWTGALCIIAGAFGVASSYHKTNCFIITFMVMSILASILTVFPIITAAADIGFSASKLHGDNYDYPSEYTKSVLRGRLATSSFLLLFALLEMAIAIWSAVICCKVMCCLPGMSYNAVPYTMPTEYQYNAHNQVVLLPVPSQMMTVTNQHHHHQGYFTQQPQPTFQQVPPTAQGGRTISTAHLLKGCIMKTINLSRLPEQANLKSQHCCAVAMETFRSPLSPVTAVVMRTYPFMPYHCRSNFQKSIKRTFWQCDNTQKALLWPWELLCHRSHLVVRSNNTHIQWII